MRWQMSWAFFLSSLNCCWVMRKWAAESLHHEIQPDREKYCEAFIVKENDRKNERGKKQTRSNPKRWLLSHRYPTWRKESRSWPRTAVPSHWKGVSSALIELECQSVQAKEEHTLDHHLWFCLVSRQLTVMRKNILEKKWFCWSYK